MLIDDIIADLQSFSPFQPDNDVVFIDAFIRVSDTKYHYAVQSYSVPRSLFIDWLKNESPTATFHTVEVTGVSWLNIRQAPSLSAKILGQLSKGAKVTVDYELSGWYKLAGGWGWIAKQYTKPA